MIKSITIISALAIFSLSANDIEINLNEDHNNISLIGETHSDREDRKFNDFLFKEAENGNIILACEGAHFGEELNNNTFGIDEISIGELLQSLYYHTLLSFYKMTKNLNLHDYKNIGELSEAKSFLTKKLLSNCVYHLEQMCGTAFDMWDDSTEKEEIFFKCKELVSYLATEDQDLEDHYLIKNNSFKTPFFLNLHPDILQWLKMFKASFDLSAKKVTSSYGAEISHSVNNTTSLIERFQTYLEENIEKMSKKERLNRFTMIFEDCKFIVNFAINQIIDLRDPILLENIIKIFENNKSRKKPFYAVVGRKHIPYVYEGLKEKGYQVELNKVAQTEYDEFLKSNEIPSKKEL